LYVQREKEQLQNKLSFCVAWKFTRVINSELQSMMMVGISFGTQGHEELTRAVNDDGGYFFWDPGAGRTD
jgi:hypothetical protein